MKKQRRRCIRRLCFFFSDCYGVKSPQLTYTLRSFKLLCTLIAKCPFLISAMLKPVTVVLDVPLTTLLSDLYGTGSSFLHVPL